MRLCTHVYLWRQRFVSFRSLSFTLYVTCICLDAEWWKNELFPRCVDSLMHLGMFFGPWWRWYVCPSACVRSFWLAPYWMWLFRRPVYCAIILWYTPFSAAIAWLWACGRGDVTSRLLPSQPQLTERHKLVRSCLRAHPSRLVVPHTAVNQPSFCRLLCGNSDTFKNRISPTYWKLHNDS